MDLLVLYWYLLEMDLLVDGHLLDNWDCLGVDKRHLLLASYHSFDLANMLTSYIGSLSMYYLLLMILLVGKHESDV